MARKVEIIQREAVFEKAIFRVEQATLRHEKYDGSMSEPLTRLCLERGDAVAALIHLKASDEVIFIEQFRYPTHEKSGGWLLEIPAGMIGESERPQDAMRRELIEETGYHLDGLHSIGVFYLSPGGSSERIHLFYAAVSTADQRSEGGGIAHEEEDIRLVKLPIKGLNTQLALNGFQDAKTLIAVQWLLMNQHQLEALTAPFY